jgi:Cu(I)/Ag(I) efflux system protein CusF
MKASLPLAVAALASMAIAGAAAADQMKDMSGMKGMSMPAGGAAKTGHATGVVTAVDANGKTITIKHGPIPAVAWPAMTMTFKAEPAKLADTVKPGDKVAFDVKVQGSNNTVTAIRKQ